MTIQSIRRISDPKAGLLAFLLLGLSMCAWAAFGTSTASAYPTPIAAYSFDEGEGKTLNDSAGNHDGAITGASWTSEGKYDSALNFDGVDDVVSVADANDLDLTGPFTMEAWVRPDSLPAWSPVLSKGENSGGGASGYGLSASVQDNLSPIGRVANSGSLAAATAASALPTGEWSHLAFTSDGSTLRLYVDGELQSSESAIAAGQTGVDLQIGRHSTVSASFDGLIDEVRLYEEALSQAQIDADSTELKGSFSTDPELFPEFDPQITDYVVRCDGVDPVEVTGVAAPGTSISVDGQPLSGASEEVSIGAGQSFEVSIQRGEQARSYFIRCLPLNFPTWNYEQFGQAHHPFYITNFLYEKTAVIFDDHGVPVWWYESDATLNHATMLSDGSIVHSKHSQGDIFSTDPSSAFYVRNLDGTLVEDVESELGPGTVKGIGSPTDFHSFKELSNGNFLVTSYPPRENVDLSGFCEPVAAYSFEEGEGKTLGDSAGNHDGTITGASWTSEGKYGSALNFDGVDDVVSVADAHDLDLTRPFTMEAWVRPDSLSAWSTVLTKVDYNGGAPSGYALYAQRGDEKPGGEIGNSGTVAAAPGASALPTAKWSHLAFTSDGDTLRLYIDGVLVGSKSAIAMVKTGAKLEIGSSAVLKEHFKVNGSFDGLIDEVRIYEKARSQTQIKADLNGTPIKCGGSNDTVADGLIQEVTADGELVWEWETLGHISLEETANHYRNTFLILGRAVKDIVHINAVEPDGSDAVLFSARHPDAIYKVDKATGEIIWKLGGTPTAESLTVLNDPKGVYPLGGQHDIRLQPDGTITIHDNRTDLGDAPRAVRYEIDEEEMTATLVEEVTDADAPTSGCCGSARRSADGSWVMSWGQNSLISEFGADHQQTFKLELGVETYRAIPVPAGTLDIEAIRAGMDSMEAATGVFVAGGESEEEAKQPRLEAESYPLTLTGQTPITLANPQKGSTVECKGVGLQGELTAASADLALIPDYGQCTASTKEKTTFPVTVDANSCHFTMQVQNAGPPYSATLGVGCDKEGDGIEYLLYAGQEQLEKEEVTCTVEIVPQQGLEGIDLENVGQGSERRVSLDIEAAGVDWENGCDNEPSSTGVLSGKVTLQGVP